jgi:NAD(P)-dependent dehydrogenase (short-subunit alcohol dehydrogenase family)
VVAVVTGAGRGVGRAIAVALADAGFAVALLARSKQELDDAARAIGSAVFATACDVRDIDAVARAVASAEKALGPTTLLVNNAGTGLALGPLWEVDPDEWWTDVETTLRGAFNLCRAVVPGMLERRGGRIVNVTSYVAVRPSPYQTGYAAGKAGLLSLTESLAASLAPHGVHVFAMTPGYVRTQLTQRIADTDAGRTYLPEVGQGRVVEAQEGAHLVVRLANGDADALNGRFFHALDDLDDMLRRREEVEAQDLYVPRLKRLASPAS